ncbi:GNAT family N-acetyltransferase [Kocuria salina]|uniref:GNAT family N-acetyltransferase n=1 Tax=Kocuria salina TaxID=1929416 RepID=UPI0015934B62|nr:GNAT family N-acetyltransferase [Kocuria salina]NVC25041.1 GNAT family N-acetyltransferase [Kocuria salina]
MISSRLGPVEQAVLEDATVVHELRRQIEDWLGEQGIEQWGHGHVSRQEITEQIQAGQWNLARDPAIGVAAAVRLLWADPEVWGAEDTPAVYVHGLMVHRGASGRGLGAFLLDWAAERGRAEGAEVIRLDCVESNTVLRTFYQRQGFQEVGRRDFNGPWYSATLLEKTLPPGPPSASLAGRPIVHGQ